MSDAPIYSFVQGDEINLVVTTDKSVASPSDIKFVLERNGVQSLQKTYDNSEIAVDGSTQFTITLNKADTLNLAPGAYYAQALLIDSSAKEKAIRLTDSAGNIVETITIYKRRKFT